MTLHTDKHHIAHLVHQDLPLPFIPTGLRILKREAARAIVIRHGRILLLYTERYDDFSFPGGGIDQGESPETGLHRELYEETGAQSILVKTHFGYVTEYMPTWKKQWDVMYQTSHWYTCDIGHTLGDANLEDYEVANGMSAVWMTFSDAIEHNRSVIERQPASMGLTIHRETLVLVQVARSLGKLTH